ncbi:CASP8 and FADD-like apoptosis regulator [Sphaeramia orbicularis]|uniref:CASP8 and FADD-like apoptosis regulator n=1 Tax=Sphaeramia orbicularis TaxID=375764 RepID=A0A673CB08_9TELE|nr:CASP8 and FADD-like apoptosis regulator [Sphaeramia orbicularis]XP_029981636.1 CASP8 and FADD-like apoptosis regulator [Sphaeramia orbicularis]
MADKHLLQLISRIVEALNQSERRRLLYLCGSLDTDSSIACVKETLKSKVRNYETDHSFLVEILLQMRRYDILRKVFGYSRNQVEKNHAFRKVLPKFRVLMADVSEDMASEDLDSMKFLLSNIVAREKLDKAQNFLDVITELEKLDKVSSEQVDLVEECLTNIGRVDLAKNVKSYKMTVVTSEQHLSQQQRCRAACPNPIRETFHWPQQARQVQTLLTAATNIPSVHTPVQREQNHLTPIDCYTFNTNPRGVCVIIDCVGNDGEMLEHTFRSLHFNVFLHKLLNVDDTLSTLREIFRNRQNQEGDGFVCCIISRGTADYLLATDTFSTGLRLDAVRQLFNAEACPMLAGKPKLFFIQRYSVPEFQPYARTYHRDEDLETDGLSRRDYIPTDADVFWSHCWTDECQLEQRDHHSIYLKSLTKALQTGQIRKTHLVDAHIEVNAAIYNYNASNSRTKYNIDLKHTLRKNLYLY